MTVSRLTFERPEACRAAMADFLLRGYRIAPRHAPDLWPGEIRMRFLELEWCPALLDPAEPLWELLRGLHEAGNDLVAGLVLHLLLERGMAPRQVVAIVAGGAL